MIVRDYQPSDFASLDELWRSLDMGSPERGDTPEVIERTIKMGGKLLIMENPGNNEIIGSSWMTYDGRRVMLHHFGIKKSYQEKGLGTLLVNESIKFLKAKGAQVKLEVHKENVIAKHLYQKAGFFAFTDYDIYMIRDLDKI